MITKENLTITGIDSVIEITEFQMIIKPNDHASCFVTCSIHKELPYYILNEQVMSVIHQKNNSEELLFRGVVDHFQQKREKNVIEVSLWLLSASIQLDYCKHIRTFQNTDQSYRGMIKSILELHTGADALFTGDGKEEEAIQELIVQYQESDWDFLKRIAGHLGSAVIPDIRTGEPKLYIGVPEGAVIQGELEFSDYTVSIDKRFYENKNHLFSKDYFISYHVDSENSYSIGTRIYFKGRTLSILSCSAKLRRGEVIFSYEIGLPALYHIKKYCNSDLAGASLLATVIESDSGTVKVLFDVNPQEKCVSKVYPWIPAMGNLFSCMPEPGESVHILFQTGNEADAAAVEAWRKNDISDCRRITSPADRCFSSTAGKEMKLIPDSIGLDNQTGNSLLLEDQMGIFIDGKKVEIEAKGSLVLDGNQIYAFAPLQTTLLKGTAGGGSINICQDFNTSGQIQFLAQAVPYPEEEPIRRKPDTELGEIAYKAIGMIPTGKSEEPVVNQALGMLVQGRHGG